jgi:uncharacterized membrane protein YidH (DUF202 family)
MVWVILTMPHRKAKHSQSENRTYLAMEQTVLSKERTILSFMQTGLAFIGVGVVLINVFALSSWSVLVGSVLIIIGFIEVLESNRRLMRYQAQMRDVRKQLGKYAV